MTTANSNNCLLYGKMMGESEDPKEVWLYKDAGRTQKVAYGSAPESSPPYPITLTEDGSGSGLSGTVNFGHEGGTSLLLFTLDCNA